MMFFFVTACGLVMKNHQNLDLPDPKKSIFWSKKQSRAPRDGNSACGVVMKKSAASRC